MGLNAHVTCGRRRAADAAGTIFIGHITGELQADIEWSRDDGRTWPTANDVATLPSPGAASLLQLGAQS